MFESGKVLLPASAPWVEGYIDEIAMFPAGAHDDQVDATSQALLRLALRGQSTTQMVEIVYDLGERTTLNRIGRDPERWSSAQKRKRLAAEAEQQRSPLPPGFGQIRGRIRL